MQHLWLNTAAIIEFVGALMITGHIIGAIYILINTFSIYPARQMVANGAITGLDFKLAATLLKALTLLQWQQIGTFAAIFSIRFILKHAFLTEQRSDAHAPTYPEDNPIYR